jgi:hypothetical protein
MSHKNTATAAHNSNFKIQSDELEAYDTEVYSNAVE